MNPGHLSRATAKSADGKGAKWIDLGMREIRDIPKLLTYFEDLPEPRDARGKRHKLLDIVGISILAVISGANTFTEIHQYGLGQQDWLAEFLELPHGIPGQDTYERVFAVLSPHAWQNRFLEWTRGLSFPELAKGEDDIFAVDGKTSRRSYSAEIGALHTVSVWSSQAEMVLAQEQVDEKTNEITVIPDLLEVLAPAGAVVTIDAMGCQKNIALVIREYHADYVLALKDNHPKLFADTKWLFEHGDKVGWNSIEHSYCQTHERGHGRQETRECWVLANLDIVDNKEPWKDLHTVSRVRSVRVIDEKRSLQDRFFISSLPCDAPRHLKAVRAHWGIENGLHWVLDTAFDEDQSRVRKANAQANFVTLRHIAINLLKRDKTIKVGIQAKRMRAAWDKAFLINLLHA